MELTWTGPGPELDNKCYNRSKFYFKTSFSLKIVSLTDSSGLSLGGSGGPSDFIVDLDFGLDIIFFQ